MIQSRPPPRQRKAPVVAGDIAFCSRCKPSARSSSSFLFTNKFSLTRHRMRQNPRIWPGRFPSIVLKQVGYWISNRVRPPLPQFTNALLGHITLFLTSHEFRVRHFRFWLPAFHAKARISDSGLSVRRDPCGFVFGKGFARRREKAQRGCALTKDDSERVRPDLRRSACPVTVLFEASSSLFAGRR